VIEWLVKELVKRGYRVAVIKHIGELDFEVDYEGTDTWRFSKAGANIVVGISTKKLFLLAKMKDILHIDRIISIIGTLDENVDYVLIEGFSRMLQSSNIAKVILIKDEEELKEFSGVNEPIIAVLYRNINTEIIKNVFGIYQL